MERLKFKLSSDQLELLLAFENSQGLAHLAESMAKDPSVVSRNLQRIAEDHPVLIKVKGRWSLTPLGIQINDETRAYLEKQAKLLTPHDESKNKKSTSFTERSVLVIINAQNGLLDATQEGRNNSSAELNIVSLLDLWRSKKREIIHVKHVSDNPSSHFYRKSAGCNFLDNLTPINQEHVVEKTKSSAFAGTQLENLLSKVNCTNLILVGFTANECIDATVRDAVTLGIESFVVGDATATFDLRDPSGKLIKAERVHKLSLANINALYAKVINTNDLLN